MFENYSSDVHKIVYKQYTVAGKLVISLASVPDDPVSRSASSSFYDDHTCTKDDFLCSQDQYDNLAAHTHKGIEFLDKYGNFVKDRCAIELEYAGKLR